MIDIEINTDDLLKWSRYLTEIPRRTPTAIARALNSFGRNVETGMLEYLSASTGLDPEQIRSVTTIDEASAGHLEWKLDATRALLTDADEWRRPWDSRPSDSEFEQEILLNIVTQQDACPVCEEAAEHSPYTAAEISNMAAEWINYVPPTPNILHGDVTNLLHPRCRCSTQQWNPTARKLPVVFGGEAHQMTVEQIGRELGKAVLDELEGEIRAIVRG